MAGETFEVRPARRDELATLVTIERSTPWPRWDARAFESEISLAWSRVEVAQLQVTASQDGSPRREVVGFMVYWVVADEVQLLNIATLASHRRKGVARALMDCLFSRARDVGASRITLEVRQSNAEALRLYERFGFARCGVRPHYYSDTAEDAILMERTL